MIRAKVKSPVIKAKLDTTVIKAKLDTTIVRLMDLGITNASVGNIAVIRTVDACGTPTEWEAVDPMTILGVSGIVVDGDGNAVTDVSFDQESKIVTFTKGNLYTTQQDVDTTIAAALECGTF